MSQLNSEIAKSGMSARDWYRLIYMESGHWKSLKIRKLAQEDTCEVCGQRDVDVHHVNYRNIFDVELSDLKVLCRYHHKLEHKKEFGLSQFAMRPSKPFKERPFFNGHGRVLLNQRRTNKELRNRAARDTMIPMEKVIKSFLSDSGKSMEPEARRWLESKLRKLSSHADQFNVERR